MCTPLPHLWCIGVLTPTDLLAATVQQESTMFGVCFGLSIGPALLGLTALLHDPKELLRGTFVVKPEEISAGQVIAFARYIGWKRLFSLSCFLMTIGLVFSLFG